ncbi:unnamed protein product [Musa hybrid cultivar]
MFHIKHKTHNGNVPGHLSLSQEPRKFELVFKMSRKTFNYICSLVRNDLIAKASKFAFADGIILSVENQVAVALRRLGSGESLLNIGVSFGMNHSTVFQVTWQFVEETEHRGFFRMCEKGMRLNGEKVELPEGSEVRD